MMATCSFPQRHLVIRISCLTHTHTSFITATKHYCKMGNKDVFFCPVPATSMCASCAVLHASLDQTGCFLKILTWNKTASLSGDHSHKHTTAASSKPQQNITSPAIAFKIKWLQIKMILNQVNPELKFSCCFPLRRGVQRETCSKQCGCTFASSLILLFYFYTFIWKETALFPSVSALISQSEADLRPSKQPSSLLGIEQPCDLSMCHGCDE